MPDFVDDRPLRNDYGAVVFGRIFPHRIEDLEYAVDRLTLEHFWRDQSGLQRTFWAIVSDYWTRYRELFPAKYLSDLLEQGGVEASKILLLTNAYDSYVEAEVSEGAFRAAVDKLRDSLDRQQTGQALTTAFDILERGLEIDGEMRVGHSAAREFFLRQISDIEEREATDEAPEGDVRDEAEQLIAAYKEDADADEIKGIQFGIDPIDEATGGIQPGEFALIAAYTNQGKSQICAQLAWHTVVKQQRGLFFATTETVRSVTIRRILSRHSREPQFGLPDGLDAKKIQLGQLSDREQQIYFDVIEDFTKTAAMCHISQMPSKPTVDFITHRSSRVNQNNRVDLILVDYLQLLKVPGRPRSEREDFNEIIQDSKRLAVTFDGGRGVALVSPWQVKQSAFQEAMEAQHYNLASLSDTSRAEKDPDMIAWLLRPDNEGRIAKMGTMKQRDGATLAPFDIEVDYRTSYLGSSGGSRAIGSYRPQTGQQSLASTLSSRGL